MCYLCLYDSLFCYHVAYSAITFLIDSENVAEEHNNLEEEFCKTVIVMTHTAAHYFFVKRDEVTVCIFSINRNSVTVFIVLLNGNFLSVFIKLINGYLFTVFIEFYIAVNFFFVDYIAFFIVLYFIYGVTLFINLCFITFDFVNRIAVFIKQRNFYIACLLFINNIAVTS